MKKDKREWNAWGYTQDTSPEPMAGKTRRADFLEFLQLVRLKDWSIRSPWAWLG